MQRKYFGFAIAMFATLGPVSVSGGDREIADQIISRLNASRESGQLKDFTLDMKVDKGVVLFRGKVSQEAHKNLVLNSAEGIDGIANIVDEVSVAAPAVTVLKRQWLTPIAVTAPAVVVAAELEPDNFELEPDDERELESDTAELESDTAELESDTADTQLTVGQALAVEAESLQINQLPIVMPGEILRTAAIESTSDEQVVSGVVAALQTAKRNGQLRGFGVDVKSNNGVLQLTGRAGSADQRDQILRIAEGVPGVSGIREAIRIPATVGDTGQLPGPQKLQPIAETELTPLNPPTQMAQGSEMAQPRQMAPRMQGTPAQMASADRQMPAMTAPYRMPAQHGAPTQAMPAAMGYGTGMGAPVVGQPVPMGPYTPVGAPRYDSPNLPNYAWPGYASHPNYAALSYPQQYSPSAWPYIGPFYPYPQVPLGWRKISLEWDDGWWFLDFTDK